jgi:uncharacterized UPF0160 family protein
LPSKPWTTRLSSAGLVYLHFGKRVLAQLLNKQEDDSSVALLFDIMYAQFIEEVDAIDNGEPVVDGLQKYVMYMLLPLIFYLRTRPYDWTPS